MTAGETITYTFPPSLHAGEVMEGNTSHTEGGGGGGIGLRRRRGKCKTTITKTSLSATSSFTTIPHHYVTTTPLTTHHHSNPCTATTPSDTRLREYRGGRERGRGMYGVVWAVEDEMDCRRGRGGGGGGRLWRPANLLLTACCCVLLWLSTTVSAQGE